MELPDADEVIVVLFREHARSLVRMARLFADDRNAAEDIVQEAFLRLHRALHRIQQPNKAAVNSVKTHLRRGMAKLEMLLEMEP